MASRSSSSHASSQPTSQRRASGSTTSRTTNGVTTSGAVASGAGTSALTQSSARSCNGDSNKNDSKDYKVLKYHKGLSPSAKRSVNTFSFIYSFPAFNLEYSIAISNKKNKYTYSLFGLVAMLTVKTQVLH